MQWRRSLFAAVLWTAIGFLCAFMAGRASAAEVSYFVTYSHTSDITRGRPFNDKEETHQDYVSPLGMTITAGKRRAWEIDLSHGIKSFDRHTGWESGSQFNVRFYPWRARGK